MLDNVLRIAMVGVGPRGLNVFEHICANARQLDIAAGVELVVIDSNRVGTGSVWRTDQSWICVTAPPASRSWSSAPANGCAAPDLVGRVLRRL
ncbi:FAD/NAD(P)-binding protein [Nocardia tengchongensis]|uniref:FAD/NAD(P)-binding protein n=1 Tax=Nocardia tengchongensis TaxID=2055889 RepID=A0ABX8CPW9_9NOCA|nr:FAD/NAD(P)-binding protein [Nocardia tengchongensis]QVI21971.1 FAD/NAD(P)-binding protein [Nocardia tengchongensis]